MVPSIQTGDPLRALDWRWRRALRVVDHGLRPHDDDTATVAAALYLRGRRRTDCLPSPRGHALWDAIRGAHQLAGSGDPRRPEIDARILAGQSDTEIAARWLVAPEVVSWYEALFFHVRDRLGARDWIMHRAIGVGVLVGCCDRAAILRYVGYYGGPGALDVMISAMAGATVGPGESAPEVATAPADRVHESARMLALTLMIPPKTSMARLAELHLAICREETLRRVEAAFQRQTELAEQLFDAFQSAMQHPDSMDAEPTCDLPPRSAVDAIA